MEREPVSALDRKLCALLGELRMRGVLIDIRGSDPGTGISALRSAGYDRADESTFLPAGANVTM